MKMKKIIFSLVAVFFSVLSYAQIEGKWKTIDDETGKPKSIVEIFKKSDGKYYGKVIQLLIKPADPNCSGCKDDRKDKPILGMEVIRGLSKDGSEFTKGTITDPKNGKTYSFNAKMSNDGRTLNGRGYIGVSALGRSQTWIRVN